MSDYQWNPMVPELLVTNFKQSLFFYTNVLGFTVQFQRSDPDFAYLDLNHVQLMLEQHTSDSWEVATMVPPFGRGVNFQIEVNDILVLYNRIQLANIKVYRELKESCYEVAGSQCAQKEFLIQDPDGYLLRFCEYLGDSATNNSKQVVTT